MNLLTKNGSSSVKTLKIRICLFRSELFIIILRPFVKNMAYTSSVGLVTNGSAED